MGVNVFGTPITTSYLKRMEEYRHRETPITQYERAKVAMEHKNEGGKDEAAKNMVKQLGDEFESTDTVCAMCLVYNATGDPVRLHAAGQWVGRACESYCPMIIANGQWGAFLRRSEHGETDTVGRFIYKGNNSQRMPVHWVTAFGVWLNCTSAVFTEIRPSSYYKSSLNKNTPELEDLKYQLNEHDTNHHSLDDTEGAAIYACIGDRDASILEVILTLPGVFDY